MLGNGYRGRKPKTCFLRLRNRFYNINHTINSVTVNGSSHPSPNPRKQAFDMPPYFEEPHYPLVLACSSIVCTQPALNVRPVYHVITFCVRYYKSSGSF